MNDSLFDLETVLMDSPRLAAIKAADIQTHHAPGMEEPWMAIPMHAARKRLERHIADGQKLDSIQEITGSFGIVLTDAGLCFFGQTEREVQDAALEFVMRLNQKKP